jgi:hypothetical protein
MSSETMVCCPFCLSADPNKVGIEKATGIRCNHSFHCPSPEFHGNPFRICPHCAWSEDGSTEQQLIDNPDRYRTI